MNTRLWARGALPMFAMALAACAHGERERAANGQWFIAAANPYAVEAGAEILKRGGSAVDAAIATQAALGLVEPQSSGLGGGAFLLHFDPATDKLEAYDGREVAPASATPDRFIGSDGAPMKFYDAVASGLSVGVPGAVRMLALAHQEHGRLAWRETLAPAEKLARDGFAVSPRLNKLLGQTPRLKTFPAAQAYFYDEAGAPRAVGHILKNPAYADTLRRLMDHGAEAFYAGPVAQSIVDAVAAAPNPGGMTLADIAAYRPVKREAVCGPYRQLKICSMPPPSSGGVTLLQTLGMLAKFDLAAAGPGSKESLHLIFEASRLAYADRARYLADQDQAAKAGGLTAEEVIAGLLDEDYVAARAALIDPAKAAATVEAGDPALFTRRRTGALGLDASAELPSTSHFTIVDAEGRVVSMTTTVEFAFGSHIMASGMILNNQLTDFSFLPTRDGAPVANAVAPGKRPRSSMTPTVIFDEDGDLWGAIGSPGGPAIIGYVAKSLIAMADWGKSAQEAFDLPNVVYPREQPVVEKGKYSPEVIEALKALGHPVMERDLDSGLHGFRIDKNGRFDGGADRRREGVWQTGVAARTPAPALEGTPSF